MPFPQYTGQMTQMMPQPAPMGFQDKMGSMMQSLQGLNPQMLGQLLNHPEWLKYLMQQQSRPSALQGINAQMPVRPAMAPTPMMSPMNGVRG